ncbi:hypothetical protein [Gemmatimonas sp.]|uniref:hypothetical protein n=1 Tax=Gemmatimonas sp. TaxID=1962908 RepID=UPI00356B2E84
MSYIPAKPTGECALLGHLHGRRMAITEDTEYMTLQEAAVVLRATPDHVRRSLHERGGPAIYYPLGRGLVNRAELAAYIRTTGVKPTLMAKTADRRRGPQSKKAA